MPRKIVYILHKNGANSHYTGLETLLKKEGIILKYREFSIFGAFFKSLFAFNIKLVKKQGVNVLFLLKLLLFKDIKVVLGIAPFDSKMIFLKNLLKKHKVYYHSSWTYWDGSFHPKQMKNTIKVKHAWKQFLENDVKHIFTVTAQSKKQLLSNFNIKSHSITIVYHALNPIFFKNNQYIIKKPLSFIYLGRLLPQKGILELLNYFSKQKKASFTIVGNGKEESIAKEFSSKYNNINFLPFTKDKDEIVDIISKHEYLLLNSKKTPKWEELFGLVIIECMAQGTIPIATNHSGPKEIITKDIGYLSDEGNICSLITERIKTKTFNLEISNNGRKKAKFYHVNAIAKLWNPILN